MQRHLPIRGADLLDYFQRGAIPRSNWKIGMEIEKLGRDAVSGAALPFDGPGASVRSVIESIRDRRGGDPVYEGDHLIGVDAPWGTISIEPGGQVEWSSRPEATLGTLQRLLDEHLQAMHEAGVQLGVRWLDVAVDPLLPVSEMQWMPKARYVLMREHLGARGRLGHRMMTQTASVQCAFDYADALDWSRKFRAASLLTPVAVALFANSERVDGKPSGWRSYRQAIWMETDPQRCGMPDIVFDPGFDIERWLDWVLDVPMIFRQRVRGLVPAGGVRFRELIDRTDCDAGSLSEWELHASTIFTEIRSYTYIEIRSADLQPDGGNFAVPAFWTGILYDGEALAAALDAALSFDSPAAWREALVEGARRGLAGRPGRLDLGEFALRMLRLAAQGLERGAGGLDAAAGLRAIESLASRHGLTL